jgi:hypothetical protein
MVRDPYEATMVEIRQSTIDGAAEGLFTLQVYWFRFIHDIAHTIYDTAHTLFESTI